MRAFGTLLIFAGLGALGMTLLFGNQFRLSNAFAEYQTLGAIGMAILGVVLIAVAPRDHQSNGL
jgi:hypothetical protein